MITFRSILRFTALALASSHSSGMTCVPHSSSNTWDWGLGSEAAWVQYGDKHTKKQVITFMRSQRSEALRIYFHNASRAVQPKQKIPAFAEFSFEAETGASTVAVDGVGTLQTFQDGLVGLSIGNLEYPEPAMPQFAKVAQRAQSEFKFYISNTCYEIPLSKAARVALRIVFARQFEFNRTALGLNDVRDGKVDLAEFAKR